MTELNLTRDPFGALVYVDPQQQTHTGITPVRAFPLSAPDGGIALLSAEGHELHWFDSLDGIDATSRRLIEDELSQREFIPEIKRIMSVASFATPSDWRVETSRGTHALTLKSEDDIRRLPDRSLLIADSHGLHYRILDPKALDRESRRLLDRFL